MRDRFARLAVGSQFVAIIAAGLTVGGCASQARAQDDKKPVETSKPATVAPANSAPSEGIKPHAGMMRYPDVSATHVVFAYANDLWLVPREGGVAQPLSSPPGEEDRKSVV